MAVVERFTHREITRILGVTEKQLAYWERLGFARPRARWGERFYCFSDLISLRTVKQLTESGVPAARLHRAVDALQKQLLEVRSPLTELRILSNGRNVVVAHHGAQLEPLSGQMVLDFDTRELGERIRTLPDRDAAEWFELALDLETDPDAKEQAAEAYRHAIERDPGRLDAHVNLGTLRYEQGNLEEAAQCFRRAAELDPNNALAHFNLGTVLHDAGDTAGARVHLCEAIRLKPDLADAHYNLALVVEKLGRAAEARQHWRRYLELDPHGPWAEYVRGFLARSPA